MRGCRRLTLGRWSPRGIEMRPLCLVALCCAASRLVFSHCVRARREFAPAGDSLSLLVQRKWTKKAPQFPSGCRQCTSAACSAAVLSQQLASRLKQLGLSLAPHTSADRGVLHCSICTHRGTCTVRRTPALAQRSGEVRLGAGRYAAAGKGGAVRAERRVAAKAVPWSRQQTRTGDTQMGFEVLSLLPFFAPAKKGSRQPGRIPGGLSRSEKKPGRRPAPWRRGATRHAQPTC
jgi:hypothetical protein